MKRAIFFITIMFSFVILTAMTSWALSVYSYQCQIVKIVHDTGGTIVHVIPGIQETNFSDEARVFIDNDQQSEAIRDMVLSAASGGKEIVISTIARISWTPQMIESVSIVVSDDNLDQQREVVYHGPLVLTSYAVDNNGSYYYVKDPSNLPENAIAVRVPPHKPTLAAFMTNAYMNKTSVSVAISHRWWLGPDKLAWTIYAAKLE
ncbi:MAG: hypothetical protein U5R49_05740 [Deltaproteobacteria bacterium]|nr:hypothetical protein [Deltaproteobacteria bacterium]